MNTKIPSRYVNWIVSEDEKFVVAKLTELNKSADTLTIYLFDTIDQVIHPKRHLALGPRQSVASLLEDLNLINQRIATNKYKITFVDYGGNVLPEQPQINVLKFKIVRVRRSYNISALSEIKIKKLIKEEHIRYINEKQNRLNAIVL